MLYEIFALTLFLMLLRFVLVGMCCCSLFILTDYSISFYEYTTVNPVFCQCILELFSDFCYCEEYCYDYMCACLQGYTCKSFSVINLGVELLDHRACDCSLS